ncbi:DNA-binding protein [Paradevosia shaoguanensis]|uniref:DNA-binding protein n=1 Tax=Paradevosia shaoguanensis TaxID=1335043 RepID=A0AA41QKD2_9HYPH|nr:DNA-binding protein [Paradevosia shaoguanensis]MCF1742042.1 DNA-binding protein [Paradevosia shaoguanensis]MCI0126525.1 DNA-binding protein [Paradevosia shaoguanensis]
MTFSSSLADDLRPLVLDTSVLINLHACTYGERVLTAITNDIVVPDIVARELEHETGRKNGDHSFLRGLIARGKVVEAGMIEAEYELFAILSGGSPSLDDGEAATIAIAARRGFRAVVDERKGRTRAAGLMDGQKPGWSLDLLLHPSVVQSLGEDVAADAVYLALRDGRMRIPAECGDEVVGLIGRERALECSCLPYFKNLSRGAALSAPPQASIRQGRSDTE